jgi:hypothetical protein
LAFLFSPASFEAVVAVKEILRLAPDRSPARVALD